MRGEKCGNCRFYLAKAAEGAPDAGICRVHPPRGNGWPQVSPGDWCGEWSHVPAEHYPRPPNPIR